MKRDTNMVSVAAAALRLGGWLLAVRRGARLLTRGLSWPPSGAAGAASCGASCAGHGDDAAARGLAARRQARAQRRRHFLAFAHRQAALDEQLHGVLDRHMRDARRPD